MVNQLEPSHVGYLSRAPHLCLQVHIAIGLDIAYDVVYLSLPNMSNECLNSHERPYSFTETHSNPREAPGSDFLNTLNAGLEEV